MSVQRCQKETTSSEFLIWHSLLQKWDEQEFDAKMNSRTKEEWYFANLLYELRKMNAGKKARSVKFKKCLLKFVPSLRAKTRTTEVDDPQKRMERSKSFWAGLTGCKIK